MKPFEINYRAVCALRTIDVGYSGLENVCGMFDLPKLMTQKNYDDVSMILKIYDDVSMILKIMMLFQ